MLNSFRKDLLAFELKIRRKEIYNSHEIAEETIKLFVKAIKSAKNSDEIEKIIKFVAEHLHENFPDDIIISNITEQIIFRINEELPQLNKQTRSKEIFRSPSRGFIDALVATPEQGKTEVSKDDSIKMFIEDILESFTADLSRSYQGIAKCAGDFVHNRDIILTVGLSNSVVDFLTAENAKCTIIIPERAPEYDGHTMAAKLRAKGLKSVIVIPDSAVFAIIPKVNLVIIPARTVLANGGIVGYSLTHSVCLAARHYAKPVVVLYWELKLTKEMHQPGRVLTTLRQPGPVLEKDDPTSSMTTAINPEGDYIPPELITLMINENGAHCPGDVFSIMQSNYYGDQK